MKHKGTKIILDKLKFLLTELKVPLICGLIGGVIGTVISRTLLGLL